MEVWEILFIVLFVAIYGIIRDRATNLIYILIIFISLLKKGDIFTLTQHLK